MDVGLHEIERLQDDVHVLACMLNSALEQRVDGAVVGALAEVMLDRLDALESADCQQTADAVAAGRR